jgi:regulator of protease activity HflC (stomatin/prohibitin superfamily)
VSAVEVKELELPEGMKRAMARQAEAERERGQGHQCRGRVPGGGTLTEAAHLMGNLRWTLQLRYLQTLREVASEKNSTTILPSSDRPGEKPFLERHFSFGKRRSRDSGFGGKAPG